MLIGPCPNGHSGGEIEDHPRKKDARDDALFLPAPDFFATCGKRVEYLLEPYIPREGFLLVGGPPKGGKTWFLAWLAAEVARTNGAVLFVEEEGSKETLRARLQPFLTPEAMARVHVAHRRGFKLDQERSVNRLIEEAKERQAVLIVLDPLVQLHGGKENEVPPVAIQAIQRIIAETGAALALAHHTRKGESWDKGADGDAQSEWLRGSGAWVGSADNIIHIKGVPPADRRTAEVRFVVENPDTRNGEPLPRRLAVVRVDAAGELDAMTFEVPESKEEALLRELLPLIPHAPDFITVDDLRKAAGVGKPRGQSAVTLGLRTGVLDRRLKGGGIYRVKNDGPSDASPARSEQRRTADSDYRKSPSGQSGGSR